jgi:integrase
VPQPVDLGGGRWRVRVFLGRDPIHGKPQTRTFTFEAKGVRAARVKAGELEREARESAAVRESFGQAVEQWWQGWLEDDHSPTTVREYRRIIDQRLATTRLWGRKADTLGTVDFDKLYDHLAKDGLSTSSVRRVHAIVVQVGKDAARRGVMRPDVVKAAQLPKGAKRKPRVPSLFDLQAVWAAAHQRDPVRARALYMSAGSALRRSELAALRWSRVDLQAGVAMIDTAAVLDPGGRVVLKGTKSGEDGFAGLPALVIAQLAEQRGHQTAVLRDGRLEEPDDWFCFQVAPPFDRPLHPDTLTRWWVQACRDAGVEGVRLHDQRHWAVSAALRLGAPVTDAQALARHQSSLTTLGVYAHPVGDAAKRAADLLPMPELLPGGADV